VVTIAAGVQFPHARQAIQILEGHTTATDSHES
jgi:hypothetical protein